MKFSIGEIWIDIAIRSNKDQGWIQLFITAPIGNQFLEVDISYNPSSTQPLQIEGKTMIREGDDA